MPRLPSEKGQGAKATHMAGQPSELRPYSLPAGASIRWPEPHKGTRSPHLPSLQERALAAMAWRANHDHTLAAMAWRANHDHTSVTAPVVCRTTSTMWRAPLLGFRP